MERNELLSIIVEHEVSPVSLAFQFNLSEKSRLHFMDVYQCILFLSKHPDASIMFKQHCLKILKMPLRRYTKIQRFIRNSPVYGYVFCQEKAQPLRLSDDCVDLPPCVITLYLMGEVTWENIQYHYRWTRRTGWDK